MNMKSKTPPSTTLVDLKAGIGRREPAASGRKDDKLISASARLGELLGTATASLTKRDTEEWRRSETVKKLLEVLSMVAGELGSENAGLQWLEDLALNRKHLNESKENGLALRLHPAPHQNKDRSDQTNNPSFLAASQKKIQLVNFSELKVVVSAGEYSQAFWGADQKMLFRKPLKQWIEELPGSQFVRIHRQSIINLDFLVSVQKDGRGRTEVRIRHLPVVLQLSQRCAPEFNCRLKEFLSAARVKARQNRPSENAAPLNHTIVA